MVEEESVVFSTIEVGNKHAGTSGLADLEVMEYIARIWRGPLERGASVHLATTEARFMLMTNSPLRSFIVPLTC